MSNFQFLVQFFEFSICFVSFKLRSINSNFVQFFAILSRAVDWRFQSCCNPESQFDCFSLFQNSGQMITVRIRLVGEVMPTDFHFVQFLNILLRNCMVSSHTKMIEIWNNSFSLMFIGRIEPCTTWTQLLWPRGCLTFTWIQPGIVARIRDYHQATRTRHDVVLRTVDQSLEDRHLLWPVQGM